MHERHTAFEGTLKPKFAWAEGFNCLGCVITKRSAQSMPFVRSNGSSLQGIGADVQVASTMTLKLNTVLLLISSFLCPVSCNGYDRELRAGMRRLPAILLDRCSQSSNLPTQLKKVHFSTWGRRSSIHWRPNPTTRFLLLLFPPWHHNRRYVVTSR